MRILECGLLDYFEAGEKKHTHTKYLQDKIGICNSQSTDSTSRNKCLCPGGNRLSGESWWVGRQCCQNPEIKMFKTPFHSISGKCHVGTSTAQNDWMSSGDFEKMREGGNDAWKHTLFLSFQIWLKKPSCETRTLSQLSKKQYYLVQY